MKTITQTYKIYNYDELTETAKNNVKEWYLNNESRNEDFYYIIKDELKYLFDSNLKIQYSLSSCQGDGVNIYGDISAESIKNYVENLSEENTLKKTMNEKEWRRILHYGQECGSITLPENRRYCYCIADEIDVLNDWFYQLENYANYSNINIKTLEKFENLVRDIFSTLCEKFEDMGYDFLYEISDGELSEICDCNDWEFFENGDFCF